MFRLQAEQESQMIVSYLGLQQMVLLSRADVGEYISYQSVFVHSREQRLQIMGLEAEIEVQLVSSVQALEGR